MLPSLSRLRYRVEEEDREMNRLSEASSSLERMTRVCSLAHGLFVTDVVDACRSAALAFAWGAHAGWGRRELARWLAGPYASAVSATRTTGSGVRRALARPGSAPAPLREQTIHELLADTHACLLEELRCSWQWSHDASSVRRLIDGGLVTGVIDDASAIGYAPVDRPRMRLFDRVRSLFVADYLTRPAEYAAFAVCGACDGATFDGAFDHVDCGPTSPGRTALAGRVRE